MNELGKYLVIIGLVIVVIGALFDRGRLGRLLGDINIERANGSVHFPIVTCLLVSLLLSFLLWLFRK